MRKVKSDRKVLLLKSYLYRGLDKRLTYLSWLVFLVLEFTHDKYCDCQLVKYNGRNSINLLSSFDLLAALISCDCICQGQWLSPFNGSSLQSECTI